MDVVVFLLETKIMVISIIFFLNFFFQEPSKFISGRVVASQDNLEGIPFSTLILKKSKLSINTDENGSFKIKIDDFNDTLQISSIGYKLKEVPLKKLENLNYLNIQLDEKIVTLNEVKYIFQKGENFTSAKYKPIGFHGGQMGSTQYGLLINDDKLIGKKIQKVSFFIGKSGIPKTPFRIRVYAFDGQLPTEDLLNTNLIVTARKHGWNEFDLSNFDIFVPEKGCVVCMEWIKDSKFTYIQTNNKSKSIYEGQTLGLTNQIAKSKGYIKINNGSWFLNNKLLSTKYQDVSFFYLNPLIKITTN